MEAVVPKLLPNGGTVVCIAGGPSLTAEDVVYCRGKALVVAVNDAYRLAPWADVLYACDDEWWGWHPAAKGVAGLKFSLHVTDRHRLVRTQKPPGLRRTDHREGIPLLRNTGKSGLETDPTGLRTGQNSGYQALNLAVHLGASEIVLLGYDMQKGAKGWHWFGSHPRAATPPPVQKFIPYFVSVAPVLRERGIQVVNCSPSTALTCFERRPLRDCLQEVAA